MATNGFHFPTERRILDDVLFRVREIVLGEYRANPVAPATAGLQIGSNLRRIHVFQNIARDDVKSIFGE